MFDSGLRDEFKFSMLVGLHDEYNRCVESSPRVERFAQKPKPREAESEVKVKVVSIPNVKK